MIDQAEEMHYNQTEVLVGDLFESSAIELIEKHGLTIKQESEIDYRHEADMLGIVGASNDDLKLSIFLQADRNAVKFSYPRSLGEPTPDAIRDWIGELSNQLIGRLKNKLVEYNCRVTMGIPSVIVAKGIEDFLPRSAVTRCFSFHTDYGEIETSVSLLLTSNLLLQKEPNQATDPFGQYDEGELAFF